LITKDYKIRVISLERKTFKKFAFEFLKRIRAIQNISEVSEEMRLAGEFLMLFFWAD
jgi:hypothetical protein